MAAEIVVLIPRKTFVALLAGLAILACASDTTSTETVSLTTYFPAPSGVYQQLMSTGPTYLATAGGAAVIGATALNPASPAGTKLDVEGNEYVNQNLMISPNGILHLKHAPFIKNGGSWGELLGVRAASPQGTSYDTYCLW